MWVSRQMSEPEWEETKELLLKDGFATEYACDEISWYLSLGETVLVAHNIQTHALLLRVIEHPKDTPASYYYLRENVLANFYALDMNVKICFLGDMQNPSKQSIIEDICEAIQTLGCLLDGCSSRTVK